MQVLLDESGAHHVVGECLIGDRFAGGPQLLERPDGHDAITRRRDPAGLGHTRLHGDHPTGFEQRCRGGGRRPIVAPCSLSVSLDTQVARAFGLL
ncbi:MAG TPA: hypothetical protein VGC05_22810 [Mycobacterium sp.]